MAHGYENPKEPKVFVPVGSTSDTVGVEHVANYLMDPLNDCIGLRIPRSDKFLCDTKLIANCLGNFGADFGAYVHDDLGRPRTTH